MPYNSLDARALNSPGGPIDALTATIRDATQASLRMRDRSEERGMRRQLLEMQQRQRGEDIRRQLKAQGFTSEDEMAAAVAEDRKRKRRVEDMDLDWKTQDRGRADLDRDLSMALASGIGTEYEQPEEVPGGIGPMEPTAPRGGVLRNLLKYDDTGMAPMIDAAAQRGRVDRDLTVRKRESDIAADEARREYYASRETATKGPMTADQAQDAAEKAAFRAMGIKDMGDLGYDLVEDLATGGMKKSPIPFSERQKRAAAFRPLYLQELNRRGFNEDGTPYVAPPVEVPPNPSDVVGFDVPELLRMRREQREAEGGGETPPIDLTQARATTGATTPGVKVATRKTGATVTAQELEEYATKHKISTAAARANLAAAGYKVQ